MVLGDFLLIAISLQKVSKYKISPLDRPKLEIREEFHRIRNFRALSLRKFPFQRWHVNEFVSKCKINQDMIKVF